MKLSPHELAGLVIKAGFSKTTIVPGTNDSEAICAVAVAIAESSLDTDVIARTTASQTSNPVNVGQRDHGIFQLSGRWQYDKIQAAGDWRDPVINVKIAYKIFTDAGRTFTPWSVFKKPTPTTAAAFEAYLPDARIAVAQPFPYNDDKAQVQLKLDKLAESALRSGAAIAELSRVINNVAADLTEVRKHFS